jgi:hypothetical protein
MSSAFLTASPDSEADSLMKHVPLDGVVDQAEDEETEKVKVKVFQKKRLKTPGQ